MKLPKSHIQLIKPTLSHLLMGLTAIVVGSILKILDPLVGIAVIDYALQKSDSSLFLILVGVMVSFIILSFAFRSVGKYLIGICRIKIRESLQVSSARKSLDGSKPISNNKIETTSKFLTHDVASLTEAIAEFLSIAAILTFIDPLVGSLTLGGVLLLTLISNRFTKKISVLNHSSTQHLSKVASKLKQITDAKNLVKLFSRQEDNILELEKSQAKAHDAEAELAKGETKFQFQEAIWGVIYTFSILTISAFAVFNGLLTLGEYIAIQIYVGFIKTPISTLLSIYQNYAKSKNSFHSIDTAVAEKNEDELPIEKGFVLSNTLRTTHLKYRKLESVTFNIEHGDHVLFTGPSGESLTNILKLISGDKTQEVGSILVGSYNIQSMPLHMSRHWSVTIEKIPTVFDGTVKENLFLGAPSNLEKATDALKQVGLAGYANLDLKIKAEDLDLETKHRLQIARALIVNPQILLVEDFTDGLGHQTITEFFQILRTHPNTLVAAGSNVQLLEIADRVIWVKDGYTHLPQSADDFFFDEERISALTGKRFQKSLQGQGAFDHVQQIATREQKTIHTWVVELFGEEKKSFAEISRLTKVIKDQVRKADVVVPTSSRTIYCTFILNNESDKTIVEKKLTQTVVKHLKSMNDVHFLVSDSSLFEKEKQEKAA